MGTLRGVMAIVVFFTLIATSRSQMSEAERSAAQVEHDGDGCVADTEEGAILGTLPYLQTGFAVVNVEYRLAKVPLAAAAVEDCLCALHWIGRNATKYNFDLSKVVVTGGSAGGHLALTTAMIPPPPDSKMSGATAEIGVNAILATLE
jgi:dienelactone hydrolase